ncbi:MAG: prepilin peptidase [Planctomycetes bacterium]|nr:prepilin peptidase [Planctomycetota bacterium]
MMLAITRIDLLLLSFEILKVVWVMAFGACLGSLTNVLVYRIPLGLGVVTPPSRCTNCETRLTWRENIPIFGWLMLGGRCRFCRSKVSPEYPIVEAVVAALFGLTFILLYADGGQFLGLNFYRWQPEWGAGGFPETWPLFVMIVTLWTCLTASLLIDARTYHIPMALTWVPALAALAAHPTLAWWLGRTSGGLTRHAPGWEWAIATPGPHGWAWAGGSIGAALGLVISNALMGLGVVKRSFADYDEWAKDAEAKQAAEEAASGQEAQSPDAPHMWIQYPHARREMLREILFLAPCIGLGLGGAALAIKMAGPWTTTPFGDAVPAHMMPLWLNVLTGVLMGYLIGGGMVWLWRIVGSLAVGKEALGLGDVHLMAAVGACLGWVDAVLAFFAAAFVGVAWTFLGKLTSGTLQRAMPFGPYLAVGTVLVWFFKPGVEKLLGLVLHNGGPIQLP